MNSVKLAGCIEMFDFKFVLATNDMKNEFLFLENMIFVVGAGNFI